MAIPDYQTLMLPALKLGATGEVQIKDAYQLLSDEFNLTPEEREHMLPSGTMTTMRNRVTWAVSYLVQAKLLHRPKRGFFTVTERGKEVLTNAPGVIDIQFLEQYPEFIEFRNKKKSGDNSTVNVDTDETSTPEERIDSAYSEISVTLKDELLSKVQEGTPTFFERLIVNLLVSMGYGGSVANAGRHVGKSGDEGIDGVITEDKLGLDIIYVQAKKYAPGNTVSRSDIQKFAGSLMGKGANKGVFVTTSTFSSGALEYAERVPQRLILIDGVRLASLMLEHNVGVRPNRSIELKKIDEDFFIE